MVEGWLRVVFDDDSSVLKLDDDEYYGSKFALMIKVLTELYKGLGHEEVSIPIMASIIMMTERVG